MGAPLAPWPTTTPGVLVLPSGRRVRGRRRHASPQVDERPDFGVDLTLRRPPPRPWPTRWVCWPDFGLPVRPAAARAALAEAWRRAAYQRVEVSCRGGRGRTGTALACLAVLDGMTPDEAVAHVRRHYDRRAVETPWQRRYVTRFARGETGL